ncbi:MAG: hypothetical protein CMH56_03715 [Myxococcales bacterium]|nr:hypothetical protein [Myxococcales bacterium]
MSERFGQYELLDKIAAGGMAEIFFARLVGVQGFARNVVVKRMLPELSVRPDFVEMFLDEARLAANLNHPNLVQVYDLGELNDAYFMAMEFIDGPHLGSLFAHSLRQGSPLPLPMCVWIVARAAEGLGFAHEAHHPDTGEPMNIVHRDISPQNILISKYGDVKVTDFGVAKTEVQHTKTRTGIIKGKVAYMSPEQCLADKVDSRTDVFALGICLYELVTRRRLYKEKSDLQIMTRITQEQTKTPSALNAEIDSALDEICLKALAKASSERFQSMAEFSHELDKWLLLNNHTGGKKQLANWIQDNAPDIGPTIKKRKKGTGESSGLSGQWAQSSDLPGNVGRTPATGSFNAAVTTASKKSNMVEPAGMDEATVALDVNTFSAESGYTQEVSTDMILGEATEEIKPVQMPMVATENANVAVATTQKSKAAQLVIGVVLLLLLGAIFLFSTGRLGTDAAIVNVVTNPAGVAILINGSEVGKSPVTQEVSGERVRVGVSFPGEPLQEKTVPITPGEAVNLSFSGAIKLQVESEPSGALVYVDEVLKGAAPLDVTLSKEDNKPINVTVKKDGFDIWSKRVTPRPGQPITLKATLKKVEAKSKKRTRSATSGSRRDKSASKQPRNVPAAASNVSNKNQPAATSATPASGFGFLTLNTQPWTTVRLGNRILGDTPVIKKKLKVGQHTLKLSNPEMGIVMDLVVQIEADQVFKKQVRISTGKIGFNNVNPGATVKVDGKLLGKTPLADFSVYPGNHSVEVTENGVARVLKVRVQPGKTSQAK